MKSRIKTLCLVVIAVFATTVVYAQKKGDMAVGGNLSVATGDDLTNAGFGAKFQWNVLDQLRIEPSVNYFFKKDHTTIWDTGANVHYLFPMASRVNIYPLAGIGVMKGHVDLGSHVSWNKTEFAFNLGGGIDYEITDNWFGNFEFKYKISDLLDRAVFSVGVAYRF